MVVGVLVGWRAGATFPGARLGSAWALLGLAEKGVRKNSRWLPLQVVGLKLV